MLPFNPNELGICPGGWKIPQHETARVHHAPRRRGGFLAAHCAQQPDRMRRIGLLMGYREGDAEGRASVAAFQRGLQELGWTEGRNIRIDTRWAGADPDKARTFAKELVGMTPDV